MALQHSQFAVLLAQARQGDESARNRLFGACRSFVAVVARVHLHRRLQSKIEPSDLVQQSLLEAHLGFQQFQGETSIEWMAWLKQIVKHNALDADQHYREAERRDLRKERSLEAADASPTNAILGLTDPGPSPSQWFSNSEREIQLAAAIEALPDDYRQVILLRNIERMPFDQVAEKMDRTRGACQMLWMRAVEHLRGQLDQESTT